MRTTQIEHAVHGHGLRLSERGRRIVVEAIANTRCAYCDELVPPFARNGRVVLGQYLIFHDGCANIGPITLRAQAREPAAFAARRKARAQIDRARTMKVITNAD